ncbi:unnamed protein product [Arctogadus glacialis]
MDLTDQVGYLVGTNGQPLLPQYLSHLDSTLIPASSARAPSSWSSSSTSWRSSPRQRSSRASLFVPAVSLDATGTPWTTCGVPNAPL